MKTVGGPARFLVKNLEVWAFSGWLPRQDFITKEIRRLLHGGKNGLSAVALQERRRIAVPSAALGRAGV